MPTDLAFLHDAYARTVDSVVTHVDTREDRVRSTSGARVDANLL
jgi:hypothetical protein